MNSEMQKKEKVVVAMSGGVDSAVSALLLMEQGYDVIGVNLRVWEYETVSCDPQKKSCCSPEDIRDARDVGLKLNIPFYVIRMEKVFKEAVMDRFVNDFASGRTPNPCVECNTFVKFGALFEKARSLGIEKIATGHYARIHQAQNGRYAIRDGVDSVKNQAYYLYGLSQESIKNTIFPLGEMNKSQVRSLAKKYDLPVAEKEESQEICFIPENDYRAFLVRKNLTFTPGYFRDAEGRILGKHDGKEKFTIGQRKGLGISWKEPLYVLAIEENGDVIVGIESETEVPAFRVEQVKMQALDESILDGRERECRVQVRYRSRPAKALYRYVGYSPRIAWNGQEEGHTFEVQMIDSVRSTAPGQSAVFYPPESEEAGNFLLAGGLISRSLSPNS